MSYSARTIFIIILLLLVAVMTVIYTVNPFQSKDHINSWLGINASVQSKALSVPSGQALEQEEKLNKDEQRVIEDSVQMSERLLTQAISPAVIHNEGVYRDREPFHLSAESIFSYQQWMKTSGGDIPVNDHSVLAALLFEAALKAGAVVGERYHHLEVPKLINLGFDVIVSAEEKDFTLFNPYPFDMKGLISVVNGKLTVTIQGKAPEEWKSTTLIVKKESFAPETVELIDFSKAAAPKQGTPGLLIKVYAGDELLYKDFYAPIAHTAPRIPTSEESLSEHSNGKLAASQGK